MTTLSTIQAPKDMKGALDFLLKHTSPPPESAEAIEAALTGVDELPEDSTLQQQSLARLIRDREIRRAIAYLLNSVLQVTFSPSSEVRKKEEATTQDLNAAYAVLRTRHLMHKDKELPEGPLVSTTNENNPIEAHTDAAGAIARLIHHRHRLVRGFMPEDPLDIRINDDEVAAGLLGRLPLSIATNEDGLATITPGLVPKTPPLTIIHNQQPEIDLSTQRINLYRACAWLNHNLPSLLKTPFGGVEITEIEPEKLIEILERVIPVCETAVAVHYTAASDRILKPLTQLPSDIAEVLAAYKPLTIEEEGKEPRQELDSRSLEYFTSIATDLGIETIYTSAHSLLQQCHHVLLTLQALAQSIVNYKETLEDLGKAKDLETKREALRKKHKTASVSTVVKDAGELETAKKAVADCLETIRSKLELIYRVLKGEDLKLLSTALEEVHILTSTDPEEDFLKRLETAQGDTSKAAAPEKPPSSDAATSPAQA